MNKTPSNDGKRTSRRVGIAAGALGAVLLLLGVYFAPGLGGIGSLNDDESEETNAFAQDPDAELARAIAEMNTIADGAAQAMAQAGAEAGAEFNATADAASEAVARAGAEGEGAVSALGNASGSLQEAPEGFNGSAEGASGFVSEYEPGQPHASAETEYEVPATVQGWERHNSSARGKLALGVPLTGNDNVDAHLLAFVDAYVSVKGNVSGVEEALANATEGIYIGVFTGQGGVLVEGENVTHQTAPDEEAAEGAYEHGTTLAARAEAGLNEVLSGVNATVAAQLELEAAVRAELEAIAEAQAEAEAEIDAQMEARVEQTFEASAEAEAEAHAEAEQRIEAAYEAHAEAEEQVDAQAEQQVSVVFERSEATAQELEFQAEAALANAEEVSAQIQANADATIELLAEVESNTGTDTSAQARAVAQAAAEAQAAAHAKAEATAKTLLRQAAQVRASAEARADVVLSVAAEAKAKLEVRLKASIDATLRAEAYTVAKIQADAKATVEAHIQAAARAKARVDAQAKGQAHILIDAAMKANAAAYVSVDGSRGVPEMIRTDTTADIQDDVVIIRDVASDYESGYGIDYEEKADHWYGKADHLETQNEVATGLTYLADADIDKGLTAIVATGENIEAMGQDFL